MSYRDTHRKRQRENTKRKQKKVAIRAPNLTARGCKVGANDRAVIWQREGRRAVGGGRRDGVGRGRGYPDREAEALLVEGVGSGVVLKGFLKSALQRHADGEGRTWKGEVASPPPFLSYSYSNLPL